MPAIVYKPKKYNAEHSAIIRHAQDICQDYAAQGYTLTLRQLYYQFVARDFIPNTDRSYKKLGGIVMDARMSGHLDWSWIVDRTRVFRRNSHWSDPANLIHDAAEGYGLDLWADQPARVEVWIEKDALVGVIERPCRELDVPFFSCRGYVSASAMWEAARRAYRAAQNGQRTVLIHLGDHDPSGVQMTQDIRNRITEFFWQDVANVLPAKYDTDEGGFTMSATRGAMKLEWGTDVDFPEVRRVALTMEQVEELDPPPNPAKLTDSRAGAYIAEYGYESWELDALPPQYLDDLVREEIAREVDDDVMEEHVARQEAGRETLRIVSDRWDEVVEMFDPQTEEED
jgi:hypothetical protein